jgi:hypothetical protein
VPEAQQEKYQQRRPENTVLYRVIQGHLESFLEHAYESSGKRLPKYVENEFRRYLECGLHAHGFARAVCETCGDELLLPFSCKLRGLCPSCNTRRMSNTAAHLLDHVIAPDVALRQWVLTVPFELRLLLAAKPDVLSAIGRIFIQEIQRWQRQQARALGVEHAEGAAVSFCQRFGSSLNLNVHWHVIVPDALFLLDAKGESVDTLKHRAPTRLDLAEIVTAVATRSVRWLEKHGYLRKVGDEDENPAETGEADSPWMRCLQGSLGVGELQRWPEHGRAEDTPDPTRGRSLPKPTKGLGAQYLKFNLHAGVSVPGGLPAARERLLRYCARPPLALERLSALDDGRICYRIKDSDQVRLMTPTQFLARLAALVPPPRHPLVRFYGVWAPHSRWRSRVVVATPKPNRYPYGDQNDSCALPVTTVDVASAKGETPPPIPSVVYSKSEALPTSSQPQAPSASAPPRPEAAPLAPSQDASEQLRFTRLSRLAWATLYQRVFDIDPLECSNCGGRMRFVEVIEDVARARHELEARGQPSTPPPLSRARSPDCFEE